MDWWKVTALQLGFQCSAAVAMTLVAIGTHCGKAGHCPLLGSCRAPRSRGHFWNTTSPSLWSLPTSSIWYSWKIQWKGWKMLLKRPPEFPIYQDWPALTSPWAVVAFLSQLPDRGCAAFPKETSASARKGDSVALLRVVLVLFPPSCYWDKESVKDCAKHHVGLISVRGRNSICPVSVVTAQAWN